MAKNIELMGAVFPDVPSILIPQHEGGLVSYVDVTDTTASASDVATGKYFYSADGARTAGTNSGGGGGASNVVQGTFTTESTSGAKTFTIPYTGNGYPIYFALWVDGGVYNDTESGNTDWYNLIQRYAIGFFSISKSRITTAPTYSGSVADNYGTVALIYKSSTTSATSYTRASSVTASSYSSADASTSSPTSVRFKNNGTTVSYFVASNSYGLAANTKYAYIAVYSE